MCLYAVYFKHMHTHMSLEVNTKNISRYFMDARIIDYFIFIFLYFSSIRQQTLLIW